MRSFPRAKIDQIRIAFDGNAVLFVSESERIYQHEGMQAFMDNGRAKADIPLQKGPFAIFLLTIAHIQELFKDKGNSPIRTALVTSRNAPAHERAIKTLRKWNVHIDEAFFLGRVSAMCFRHLVHISFLTINMFMQTLHQRLFPLR